MNFNPVTVLLGDSVTPKETKQHRFTNLSNETEGLEVTESTFLNVEYIEVDNEDYKKMMQESRYVKS